MRARARGAVARGARGAVAKGGKREGEKKFYKVYLDTVSAPHPHSHKAWMFWCLDPGHVYQTRVYNV